MNLLSKEQFLSADDVQYEKFFVAPLKGNVRIRSISATDKDRFEQTFSGEGDIYEHLRAHLIAMSVVDENGNLIFDSKSKEDIRVIGQKSALAIDIIVERIQKLNKITNEELDEAVKNFEGTLDSKSDGE